MTTNVNFNVLLWSERCDLMILETPHPKLILNLRFNQKDADRKTYSFRSLFLRLPLIWIRVTWVSKLAQGSLYKWTELSISKWSKWVIPSTLKCVSKKVLHTLCNEIDVLGCKLSKLHWVIYCAISTIECSVHFSKGPWLTKHPFLVMPLNSHNTDKTWDIYCFYEFSII